MSQSGPVISKPPFTTATTATSSSAWNHEKNSGFATKFGTHEARLFPLLELIQRVADEQIVEINLDEDHVKTHSAKGAGMVAILRDMLAQSQDNVVDAQLFAEGVALAQAQQPPVKLWHDEQRRGYFSVSNSNFALVGA